MEEAKKNSVTIRTWTEVLDKMSYRGEEEKNCFQNLDRQGTRTTRDIQLSELGY